MTILLWYAVAAVVLYIVVFLLMANNLYLYHATKNPWVVIGVILTAPFSFPIFLILAVIVLIAKIKKK
jgi:hypothetical protein